MLTYVSGVCLFSHQESDIVYKKNQLENRNINIDLNIHLNIRLSPPNPVRWRTGLLCVNKLYVCVVDMQNEIYGNASVLTRISVVCTCMGRTTAIMQRTVTAPACTNIHAMLHTHKHGNDVVCGKRVLAISFPTMAILMILLRPTI